MILVRQIDDGSYEVVNGHRRLSAAIQLRGQADVQNAATGETLIVHEVGGHLLALTQESQKVVEAAADAAIDSVRKSTT